MCLSLNLSWKGWVLKYSILEEHKTLSIRRIKHQLDRNDSTFLRIFCCASCRRWPWSSAIPIGSPSCSLVTAETPLVPHPRVPENPTGPTSLGTWPRAMRLPSLVKFLSPNEKTGQHRNIKSIKSHVRKSDDLLFYPTFSGVFLIKWYWMQWRPRNVIALSLGTPELSQLAALSPRVAPEKNSSEPWWSPHLRYVPLWKIEKSWETNTWFFFHLEFTWFFFWSSEDFNLQVVRSQLKSMAAEISRSTWPDFEKWPHGASICHSRDGTGAQRDDQSGSVTAK